MGRTKRLALLLVALAVVVAAPGAFSAATSNVTNYSDAAGDTLAAPDITNLRMTNDDAGLLTLRIAVANRSVFSQDMALVAFIDSAPGGDSAGVDYLVQVIGGQGALFRHRTGDEFEFESGAGFSDEAGQLTIGLSADAIGDPARLRFSVLLGSGMTFTATGEPVFANFRIDEAPNSGFFTYEVKRRLSLAVVSLGSSPLKPRAGQRYAVAMGVTQSTLGGPVERAEVGCAATLRGAPLAAKSRTLRNGLAICAYDVPKGSAGRPLRVTVSVKVAGVTVKRTLTAAVAG